jgi:sulfonate transport system substrate-binding protein
MTRRVLALAIALGLAAVSATACGGSDDEKSADPATVTINIGDQKGSSVQSLLSAAGELDGTSYKISWSTFPSGPPILEAINAGAVDFGAVGNSPPVFAAAAGSKIVIIGANEQKLDGQAIVVPKDSPLKSASELKGKKIAVAKGSSAHAQLLGVLAKNGLTFDDIQAQYLQPADALAALSTGKVDAWAIWEPYTSQAEIQNGARILVDGAGVTNGYAFQITSRDDLKNPAKTAALRDLLGRYQRAVAWSNAHQKDYAAVWSKDTGLPQSVTEKAAERRTAKTILLDGTVITAEQQLADAFTTAKVLPSSVKISDFIDPRFNDLIAGGVK